VRAELALETAGGRSFRFRAGARAGPDGVARLRLPYPTGGAREVQSRGPWRVWRGDDASEVEVSEAAVLRGETVRAGAAAQMPRR
jgi:hypothetical protein